MPFLNFPILKEIIQFPLLFNLYHFLFQSTRKSENFHPKVNFIIISIVNFITITDYYLHFKEF
jgi:hypothetical protein